MIFELVIGLRIHQIKNFFSIFLMLFIVISRSHYFLQIIQHCMMIPMITIFILSLLIQNCRMRLAHLVRYFQLIKLQLMNMLSLYLDHLMLLVFFYLLIHQFLMLYLFLFLFFIFLIFLFFTILIIFFKLMLELPFSQPLLLFSFFIAIFSALLSFFLILFSLILFSFFLLPPFLMF